MLTLDHVVAEDKTIQVRAVVGCSRAIDEHESSNRRR